LSKHRDGRRLGTGEAREHLTMSAEPGGGMDRNLAFLNYGLLIGSVILAGAPALVAVVIAYAQRQAAPQPVRSHYVFQIRIFWIAFALSLAAGVCALLLLGEAVTALVRLGQAHDWTLDTVAIDISPLTLDVSMLLTAIAAGALLFASVLWLVAAPAFGLIRLASGRGIGHSAGS
jgi:uncharacterized membrane protein